MLAYSPKYLCNLLVLVQVVYVHPTDLPGTQVEGLHPAMVDFLADTTRTAASMVRHRALNVGWAWLCQATVLISTGSAHL